MTLGDLLAVAAVGLVGAVVGAQLAPQPDVAAAVAQAKREAGDSATAAVSQRYLTDLVSPLRDSLAYYRARPVAGTRIVVQRDTVWDTTVVELAGVDSLVVLPIVRQQGVTVAESLVVLPPPVHVARRLRLDFQPDTVLAALLALPDGSQRFAAQLAAHGWARVADAAIRPPPTRRVRLGCTGGVGPTISLDGTVRASAGVLCGVSF